MDVVSRGDFIDGTFPAQGFQYHLRLLIGHICVSLHKVGSFRVLSYPQSSLEATIFCPKSGVHYNPLEYPPERVTVRYPVWQRQKLSEPLFPFLSEHLYVFKIVAVAQDGTQA